MRLRISSRMRRLIKTWLDRQTLLLVLEVYIYNIMNHLTPSVPIQLSRLRFIAVLWCGASTFLPLVAGLSISSTVGSMKCQTPTAFHATNINL